MEPIILGIDPGSQVTGIGVIQLKKNTPYFLHCGVARASGGSRAERLQKIYQEIKRVIDLYQPTEAAIEDIFMYLNPAGALVLGQARGVALLAMAESGITKIGEYSARRVKQVVVGYGAATKEQVRFMVKTLLGVSVTGEYDATDALAIALCHVQSRHSIVQQAEIQNPQLRALLTQFPKGWRRGKR